MNVCMCIYIYIYIYIFHVLYICPIKIFACLLAFDIFNCLFYYFLLYWQEMAFKTIAL